MRRFLTQVLVVLLISAVPVFSYIFFNDRFVKIFVNDDAKHFSISQYLNNPVQGKQVLFFGSSLGMIGVNTNVLDSADTAVQYFNLCSNAQTTAELVHFLEQIPAGTKEILFCQHPTFLSGKGSYPLPNNKAISLTLSGFRTGEFENGFIDSLDNKASFTADFILSASLEFRSSLHVFLRSILDKYQKKEFNTEAFWSVKHPYPYNSERIYNYQQRMPDTPAKVNCNISQGRLETHNKIARYLAGRGIKYTILLMPMNPDFSDLKHCSFYKDEVSKSSNIEILDYSDKFSSEYFYDNGHLNKKGSTRLTQMLWQDYFFSGSTGTAVAF
ncbi:MAG TPA: hypothetical protein VEC12_06935 [Bacteroidia bacterium]|nr:hypothetical protein [Bacteroidia bacterium]